MSMYCFKLNILQCLTLFRLVRAKFRSQTVSRQNNLSLETHLFYVSYHLTVGGIALIIDVNIFSIIDDIVMDKFYYVMKAYFITFYLQIVCYISFYSHNQNTFLLLEFWFSLVIQIALAIILKNEGFCLFSLYTNDNYK